MKYIDIDTFDKKARSGGVWVLYDGNEPDRILRRAIEPGVEVERLLIPTKFIKDGEYLVIVEVTRERPVLVKEMS